MGLKSVHQQFEQLTDILGTAGSLRCKIFALDMFLRYVENNFARHESYLLELTERLPSGIDHKAFNGTNPDRLNDCLKRVDNLCQSCSGLSEIETWNEFRDQLRRAVAILYAYCGDLKEIFKLYYPQKEVPHWLTTEGSPLERVRAAEANACQAEDPSASIFNDILRFLTLEESEEANFIKIPVIEYCNTLEKTEFTGRIVDAHLDKFYQVYGRSDYLETYSSYKVGGARHITDQFFDSVLKTVKTSLKTKLPSLSSSYYRGVIRFDPSYASYEGRSAELAIAVLLYSYLINIHQPRNKLQPAQDTAISGIIDKEGSVYPIDTETLELKVEAAFFSSVGTLVVPLEQREEAELIAGNLHARYPGKKLHIFGVRSLEDVVNDRRLTQIRRTGRITYYARRAWSNKVQLSGIAIILVLILNIIYLASPTIDRSVVDADFQGSYMYLLNSQGNTVDQINVGNATVSRVKSSGSVTPRTFHALADITGDGENEVFYIERESDEYNDADVLHAKSQSGDSLLWSYQIVKNLDYPNSPDVHGSRFSGRHIYVGDLGLGVPVVILVAGHRPNFPSIVQIITATDGTPLQTYVHAGRIRDIKVHDFTGNGGKEIMLSGINNAFNEAIVTLLDPDSIQGQSPYTSQYKAAGFERANELAYVRIPRTIVGEAIEYLERFNEAARVQLYRNEELVQVRVLEHTLSSDEVIDADKAQLLFYFDYNLQNKGISSHDSFDTTARQLFNEGYIEQIPDYEYFQDFRNRLMYLNNNEEWINFSELDRDI